MRAAGRGCTAAAGARTIPGCIDDGGDGAAGAGGRQLLHDAPVLRRDHDQQVVDGAQERTVEEPVGAIVCSRKYQEAVAHAVQVAAAAAPRPQHGCVGHTPRICVPPLDRRSRRSRSGGGPCGLAVRVPPLRRSVELRTGCDQRYATKRCLQLHYLANASSTGPLSGTLRCGAASERGQADSAIDQAVLGLFLEHARPIWAIDLIWAAELAQTL